MWWLIALLWFCVLALTVTGCTRAPIVSYRNPQTGALCWGPLDAKELRCTTP